MTTMSLSRYCRAHPEFAESLARTRAAAAAGHNAPELEPPEPIVDEPDPTRDAKLVAEVLGVPAEIAMDVDRLVQSETELAVGEAVPRLTLRSYTDLCWKRASDGKRKDASAWARLLAPVMFGPVLDAQGRRAAALGVLESASTAGEPSDTDEDEKPSRAGMTVLEVPRNAARPHLHRDREILDAEVVD
jgi:hypothetical protein